jgi:hypothetical protein
MGLLATLKERFFPPELCRVAKAGDSANIADCLARTAVVVIGADVGVPVPFDADDNSVIGALEAAAKKSFDCEIHKYNIHGDVFIPIFTDVPAAESFCGAYYSLLGHIHAFRLFTILGAYIRHWINDQDFIVVNPQGNNEVEIDHNKSSAICTRLSESDTFSDAHFVSLALPMAGISRTIEFAPNSWWNNI